MKLNGFNNWINRIKQYVKEKNNLQNCLTTIDNMINNLTSKVEAYRSDTTNLIWFKRTISAMLSYRINKYHKHYPQDVPQPKSKYEKFSDLFEVFKITLWEPLIPSENFNPSYHLDIQPVTSNYIPTSPYAGSFIYQNKKIFICFDEIPYANKSIVSKNVWDNKGSPFIYTSAILPNNTETIVIGTDSDYHLKNVPVNFSDLVQNYKTVPPCSRPLYCVIDNNHQQVIFKCIQDFNFFEEYKSSTLCKYYCNTSDGIYNCIKSQVIDNIETSLKNAVKTDNATIMDFLQNLDFLDQALYLSFKPTAPLSVDKVTIREISLETDLDKVTDFFKWKIPGLN